MSVVVWKLVMHEIVEEEGEWWMIDNKGIGEDSWDTCRRCPSARLAAYKKRLRLINHTTDKSLTNEQQRWLCRGHDGGGRGGGGWRGHGDRVVSGRSARNKHHKNPARFIHDQNKHQQQEEE